MAWLLYVNLCKPWGVVYANVCQCKGGGYRLETPGTPVESTITYYIYLKIYKYKEKKEVGYRGVGVVEGGG